MYPDVVLIRSRQDIVSICFSIVQRFQFDINELRWMSKTFVKQSAVHT